MKENDEKNKIIRIKDFRNCGNKRRIWRSYETIGADSDVHVSLVTPVDFTL